MARPCSAEFALGTVPDVCLAKKLLSALSAFVSVPACKGAGLVSMNTVTLCVHVCSMVLLN